MPNLSLTYKLLPNNKPNRRQKFYQFFFMELTRFFCFFLIPRAYARGKVSLSLSLSSSTKKIARSWDLGTSATRKYNKSVEVGEKLALERLESSGTVYKLHKYCILVGYRNHTHRPCPLCIMQMFLLMRTGLVINADARRARGIIVCALRALVL